MLSQKITLQGLEELAGKVWESERLLRVGRLPISEIKFDNSRISRQHSEVLFTGERWIVRDLASTNGTYLNGMRLGAGDEVLREGDILLFAEMCVRVAEIVAPSTTAKQLDDKIEIHTAVTDLTKTAARFTANEEGNAGERNNAFEKLLQIGRIFASYRSLGAYLEAILWESAEVTNAGFGAFIMNEPNAPCKVRAMISLRKATRLQDMVGSGLGEWSSKHEGSLLCSVETGDARTNADESERASLILAKMHAGDRYLGVLCLARWEGQPPFQEDDLFLADALARSVASSIDSFERLTQSNRELLSQTLTALTNLAFSRNAYARGRAGRVTQYALFIAGKLSLSDADRHQLSIGTPLIDLGMFTLPPSLLSKSGPLSHREKLQMRSHVIKGAELLETIPALKFLVPLVRNHHENWDGSGYPDGLTGDSIPMLARVIAVADALESKTCPPPESDQLALSLNQAFEEIQSQSGKLYDPACVDALFRAKMPIEELFLERGAMNMTISREEMEATIEGSAYPMDRTCIEVDLESGQ